MNAITILKKYTKLRTNPLFKLKIKLNNKIEIAIPSKIVI
jgi:hypothetical protein